jgi:hypothetical protein
MPKSPLIFTSALPSGSVANARTRGHSGVSKYDSANAEPAVITSFAMTDKSANGSSKDLGEAPDDTSSDLEIGCHGQT